MLPAKSVYCYNVTDTMLAHAEKILGMTCEHRFNTLEELTEHTRTAEALEASLLFNTADHETAEKLFALPFKVFIDINLPLHELLALKSECEKPNRLCFFLTSRMCYQTDAARFIADAIAMRIVLEQTQYSNIRTALHEGILNGFIHGNLELKSDYRNFEEYDTHRQEIEARLQDKRYATRPLCILVSWDDHTLLISIINQGEEFDADLVKPFSPERAFGRGLHMIASSADRLAHEKGGHVLKLEFSLSEKKVPVEVGKNTLHSLLSSRILIVDDSQFNIFLIKEILSSAGFTFIETAGDGHEALHKTQTLHPDLVICDLMMPKLNGYEYCQLVRKIEEFEDLPIIVQTALTSPEQRASAFDAGATDLVNKPINQKELVARTQIHLERQAMLRNLKIYQERTRRELEQAQAMQTLLIPNADEIAALQKRYDMELITHFEPSYEMGGDLWTALPLSDTELTICIVDFSGHGVASALNTFRFHTLLQERYHQISDPGDLLSWMNQRLHQVLPVGQFATVFYGIIDILNNELRYATAATTSPILYSARDNRHQLIDGSGYPLGCIDHSHYHTSAVPFHKGDYLFLYSDALIETPAHKNHPDAGNLLSETDLCDLLAMRETPEESESIAPLYARIMETFKQHSGNKILDDLTINFYHRKPHVFSPSI